MTEPRFYIVDIDLSHPAYDYFPDWFGLVDDKAGGIIAVCQTEADAYNLLTNKSQQESGN